MRSSRGSNDKIKQTDSRIITSQNHANQKFVSSIISSKSSNHSERSNKQEGIKINQTLRKTLKTRSKINHEANQNLSSIIRSTIRVHVCQMCQISVKQESMTSIGACTHNYCLNCLEQYAIYKIQINEEVPCPQGNCQVKMDIDSNLFNLLPEQMQQRFKINQLWRQTLQNPNFKLCPSETCRQGLVQMLKSPPQCNRCKKKYCKQCMMTDHQGPCDLNFQLQFSQWKRCPSCKIFIQKTEGCNHMVCLCSHQFCYECLAVWQNSHYECIEGVNNRLFFRGEQEINKCKALLLLIASIVGFPFLVFLLVVALLIGIPIAAIIGVLGSPILLCKQLSGCGCCCCPILLPFAMIAGAFVVIGAFIYYGFSPIARRIINQYCNSISYFGQQAMR